MADLAEATITVPEVAPEDTRGPADSGSLSASRWGLTPPASARDRLRAWRPRSSGRGGGGGHGTRRPQGDSRGGMDVRNTWQIAAGSVLVPVGVVFILMAWYGAAHTAYVQQQIPYLVSGSFAGLGCIVLGGLLYWAHWLYRIYDQADLHHEEQLQAFERTMRAIVERIGSGDVPASRLPTAPTSASFVVTETGSVYHAPGCPVIAHHGEGLRILGPGAVVDMEPCRICLPARP